MAQGGRTTRPRRRRWLIAVAIVVGAWAAFVLVLAVLAVRDLRAGRSDARRARHQNVVAVAQGKALPELTSARSRFRRAHSRLQSVAFAPVRVLPYFGRQLRSATALSGAAVEVADIGINGVNSSRRVLDLPHQTGADRLNQLHALADLASRTERRLAGPRFGPTHNLVGPLASAHDEIVGEVTGVRAGLRRAAAGATAAADLLSGPRNYLVFAANNDEMRAGSGMFLSIGQLVTGGGELHMAGMQTVLDVPVPPGVPIGDQDIQAQWGWLHPETEWRNLMLSPRFEPTAALAARMWAAGGRPAVDGVVALDPVALQGILKATGPVTVNGRSIGANEVLQEALHDQYSRFPDVTARREELSVIAAEAVTALQSGKWSPAALAQGLADAGRGRHVLAWSTRADEEQAWVSAGIAGATRDDSLLVSVINRGGNKLDQYLHVDSNLETHASHGHTEAVLRLTLTNNAKPAEPPIIDGPYRDTGLAEGEYLGILTVNLPGAAGYGRIDGVDQLIVAGADGPTRVIGAFVRLARGATKTLVVRFQLPGTSGEMHIEPSAREPTLHWTASRKAWVDTGARTVTW